MMVLERGSLKYGGDHVLMGCVKDFKTLLNIHIVCLSEGFSRRKNKLFVWLLDRVVWIDVEGTSLQAWSHVTFKRIASKWGKLVYMDESNEEVNDDEVILNSFQSIVNEYNIMENYSDDVVNSPGQMENSIDHNSPNHVENYLVYVENSPEQMENFLDHVENSSVYVKNSHVHMENSPDLSGDAFGLEKLILESEKTHQCRTSDKW
ncbi:hypothetical protein Tco_0091430 [Tanacetum coccineum]